MQILTHIHTRTHKYTHLCTHIYCFTLPIITENPRQVETIKLTNTEITAHAHTNTHTHTFAHTEAENSP